MDFSYVQSRGESEASKGARAWTDAMMAAVLFYVLCSSSLSRNSATASNGQWGGGQNSDCFGVGEKLMARRHDCLGFQEGFEGALPRLKMPTSASGRKIAFCVTSTEFIITRV